MDTLPLMERLVFVIALVLSACAPAEPSTRAGQCARLNPDLGDRLPHYAFCNLGASRCADPSLPAFSFECRELFRGEQAVCVTRGEAENPEPKPCDQCPAGWECRPYDDPTREGAADPLRWCFPGPRCGTEPDASSSDASAG